MPKIKFIELEESSVVGQIAKDTVGGIGKNLGIAALAAITGGPASAMAAFNNIRNMIYDKRTYETEQEKEKRLNEVIKNFKNVLSGVDYKGNKFSEIELGIAIEFMNDFFTKLEQDYRKNLNMKLDQQDIEAKILNDFRKRLTQSDAKNMREWLRDGGKLKTGKFANYLGTVVLNLLPTFKKLELLKRKKAGQHYSPDAK